MITSLSDSALYVAICSFAWTQYSAAKRHPNFEVYGQCLLLSLHAREPDIQSSTHGSANHFNLPKRSSSPPAELQVKLVSLNALPMPFT